MRDPVLARLLTTLDGVPASTGVIPAAAGPDFAEAQSRLRAAQRRLGSTVQESPYLAFARRLVVSPETTTTERHAVVA
jgi:hypothetical protein